jgi:hypothetical protein
MLCRNPPITDRLHVENAEMQGAGLVGFTCFVPRSPWEGPIYDTPQAEIPLWESNIDAVAGIHPTCERRTNSIGIVSIASQWIMPVFDDAGNRS